MKLLNLKKGNIHCYYASIFVSADEVCNCNWAIDRGLH